MDNEKYNEMEKSQDKVIYLVAIILICVAGSFIYKTFNTNFFDDPEHWGVFGDYVGGTLNPILGFFSFMLLLLSLYQQRKQLDKTEEQLELNREELKLTREELKKAADAQSISAKVMSEQLKTQTFQQSDNLFSVMFKQIVECQEEVVKECKRCKYYSNGNLQRLRYEINKNMIFKKYFRLLFQTFSMLDDVLGKENIEKLKQYIKVIRSQQEDIVLELLFVYISENREKPSDFHGYLKLNNFFKHLDLDIKTIVFHEVLKAYEEFNFSDKDEYFEKDINN